MGPHKRRRISAVIPTFNSAAFIGEAIASVRDQTRPVDEIIVVDDGSVDNTAEVIDALGDDIVYLFQENAGPSAARNRGLAAAGGDLVAFLDADDRWTSDKTATQLNALENQPSLVLIASDMAEIETTGEVITSSMLERHGLLDRFKSLAGRPLPDAAAALLEKNFIPTGTVLAKRQALLDAGGFPERIRYGEDLALWVRIAAHQPITCLPEVHMLRRRHETNATSAARPLLQDLIRVMKLLRDCDAAALRRQGIEPAMLVAAAWNDLGYWDFDHGDPEQARRAFRHGLQERVNIRGLTYWLLCQMPAPWLYSLRTCKQRLQK